MRLRFEPLEVRRLLSADAVLDWNAVALEAVKNDYNVGQHSDQGGPTRTARALAIVHVAMYDVVTAIDRTYMPYLVDYHAAPGTSMNAAVSKAAHDTLAALFPRQKAVFDASLTTSLAGIPARASALGVQLGRRVARAILADRADDGADGPMDYTPGNQPGEYRPDPLHPDQMIISPDWNNVRPFVIASGTQFPAPPPPALTSQQYTDAFNQVKSLGADGLNSPTTRTADQTEAGIFWAYDGVPGIGTPQRLYNQITRVIAQQQGNSEVENARLFALVNVAMQDVGVVLWTTKYADNFWRPITAIRESDPGTGPTGLGDGNPNTVGDPNWTPLGSPADNGGGTNFTPAFPSYTSGHAGFGAALFGAIRSFYSTDDIPFSFRSDEFNGVTRDAAGNVRPLATRSYASLSQAAQENAMSRVYLGVHWQFDVDQAMTQGTQVANYVFAHFATPTPTQRSFMASDAHSAAIQAFATGLSVPATAAPATAALAAVDHAFATTSFRTSVTPAAKSAPLASGPIATPSASTRVSSPARTAGSLAFTSSRPSGSHAFSSPSRLRAGLSLAFSQP